MSYFCRFSDETAGEVGSILICGGILIICVSNLRNRKD